MKKILLSLTSLTVITLPTFNIISCSKPTIDPDYYIPPLADQPKNIQEIEKEAINAWDLFRDYQEISNKKWDEYKLVVDFYNLSETEKSEHQLLFNLNSLESQKEEMFYFWSITYNYKIYQFDVNYEKEIFTTKGRELHLKAYNFERYTSFKDLQLNNKFLTAQTKEHIEKIYEWGIQDNPNANF